MYAKTLIILAAIGAALWVAIPVASAQEPFLGDVNHDGAINVRAGDEMDCHVTATAFIHAPTKREAAEIGEQL